MEWLVHTRPSIAWRDQRIAPPRVATLGAHRQHLPRSAPFTGEISLREVNSPRRQLVRSTYKFAKEGVSLIDAFGCPKILEVTP